MIKETRILKKLQSQLSEMLGDAEAIKIEVANKQREYDHKLQAIKRLKEEILKFDEKKILRVSEHAIVRYFERVKGFNIGEIEEEILSDEVKRLVEVLGGSGSYPNKDYSVVMKNYTVTTIV